MVNIGQLIGKKDSSVRINTDDEYTDLALQISAEWNNIVNSPMILRDENGNRLYLRKDERIKGIDY